MSEKVYCDVERELLKRVYFALETGRDNAIEAFNSHMVDIGDTNKTRRDKYLIALLRSDIDEVESLISELSSKWQFGK